MSQPLKAPNLEAQRAAMKKLSFLIGDWSGEASVLRGPGLYLDLLQTESAHFKLDGLLLVIEGIGLSGTDHQPALQALGLISFDDEAGTYRMRAFNDGRWLETDVLLAETEPSLSWGFTLGDFKTHTILRIDESGHWTESGQLTLPDRPPMQMMTLSVRRRPPTA